MQYNIHGDNMPVVIPFAPTAHIISTHEYWGKKSYLLQI